MTGAPRSLTILQLTYEGHGAGSTQSIFSLSRALAGHGHRVLVGSPAESLLARMTVAEPSLTHVPLDFTRVRAVADAIAKVIAQHRVDVVNSHATGDRRAVTWLRWRRRLPQAFVVTRRTMPLTSPPELLAVGLTADRTIAVSAAVAQSLRRRLHPSARLRIVNNGIDLSRVDAEPSAQDLAQVAAALGGANSGRPVVVVVARRKDQQILLRALPALERPVTIAFIGIVPDGELQAAQAAVPPRHRIVFVPFTERPLAFYRFATVAALPSRIEGLSQALLEAMSLGVPVIASAAGGNPELVYPGETGLLVPPLDAAAWARALDRLLGDDALRQRLARSGRELARGEFTMERTAARTQAVYVEALQRRRLLAGERFR